MPRHADPSRATPTRVNSIRVAGDAQRPPSTDRWHNAATVCVLVSLTFLPACAVTLGGNGDVRGNNRELRVERDQLQSEVAELKARVEGLAAQLEAARAGTGPAMPGVRRPAITEARIDRYTSLLDTDDDGSDDRLVLYLTLHDHDGHATPSPGSVAITLVALDADGSETELTEFAVDPDAFAAAYRDTLLGDHYTLEADVPAPPADAADVVARVTFTDGLTGADLTAERSIAFNRARP